MRTKGAAIGTATNWICNFIVVEITPTGIQNLQWRFYIIWVVFNLVFVPTVYFFYPETANRTLEDLDTYYRDSPPLLVFRDKDVTGTKRPAKFIEAEYENVRRASSVDAATFRRRTSMQAQMRSMSHTSGMSHSTLGAGQLTHDNEKHSNDSSENMHVDNTTT